MHNPGGIVKLGPVQLLAQSRTLYLLCYPPPPIHQRMVINHLQDGQTPSMVMITHHPKDNHPPAVEWSPTIPEIFITSPMMVTPISRMVNWTWSLTLVQPSVVNV